MLLPASTVYFSWARILLSLLLLLQTSQTPNLAITIQKNEALYTGRAITFVLSAQSQAEIVSAALVHGVSSNNCLGDSQARRQVAVKPGGQVDLKWMWSLEDSGNLPPGTTIWWRWELRDASGALLSTEPAELTLEDDHLDWQILENGPVTILWSEGDAGFAAQISQITERSLERLAQEAGLQSTGPIRLMVYPSAEAMRGSLAYAQEWAGGVAFPQYNVVLVGIAPGDLRWAREVIPHELAHLITGERIYNCTGEELPTWLEEGLAEYATGLPAGSTRDAILAALDTNRLPALTRLSDGFPLESRQADQAYKQSHLVVEYLIDTYGAEAIADVLERVRQGEDPESALRAVYGLDAAGLDQAWRASLGFGEAPLPDFDADAQPAAAAAIPTLALFLPSSFSDAPPAVTATAAATSTAAPPAPSQTPPPVDTPAPGLPGTRSGLLLGMVAVVIVGLAVLLAVIIVLRRRGRTL